MTLIQKIKDFLETIFHFHYWHLAGYCDIDASVEETSKTPVTLKILKCKCGEIKVVKV